MINIKLDNIKVGDVFKNYTEMCKVLGEKVKTGNSKTSQINEWERYFSYDKVKYKFIIKEIHNKVLPKVDNRLLNGNVAPYIHDAELLLIDLMLNNDGEMMLPNSKLLKELKLVNNNYTKYYGNNRPLLANGLNIDLNLINDYYNSVNSSLTGNLKTVMNRLVKKNLLFHKDIVMIRLVEIDPASLNESNKLKLDVNTVTDNNGLEKVTYHPAPIKTKEVSREATTDEIRIILRIQRETMLELGLNKDDKYNVLYKEGLTKRFNKIVNNRLLKEYNILWSYKAHHLIFNNDHLEEERIDLLDEIEKKLIQDDVNIEVRKRIMDNARSRSNKASGEIVESLKNDRELSDRTVMRSDTSYINNHEILSTYLIDNNLTSKQSNQMFKLNTRKIEEVNIELPELM